MKQIYLILTILAGSLCLVAGVTGNVLTGLILAISASYCYLLAAKHGAASE